MSDPFESRLTECLDTINNSLPVDEILARYPEDAAALRGALAVADALSELAFEPDATTQLASRRVFLARANVMAAARRGAIR
jgi:hypothetical protein